MQDFHRGDIYEVKMPPTWEHPNGATATVVILQNDAGEIPCQTVTALKVMERGRGGANRLAAAKQKVWRLNKRPLRDYKGCLSQEQTKRLLKAVEDALGICIPEAIEAP